MTQRPFAAVPRHQKACQARRRPRLPGAKRRIRFAGAAQVRNTPAQPAMQVQPVPTAIGRAEQGDLAVIHRIEVADQPPTLEIIRKLAAERGARRRNAVPAIRQAGHRRYESPRGSSVATSSCRSAKPASSVATRPPRRRDSSASQASVTCPCPCRCRCGTSRKLTASSHHSCFGCADTAPRARPPPSVRRRTPRVLGQAYGDRLASIRTRRRFLQPCEDARRTPYNERAAAWLPPCSGQEASRREALPVSGGVVAAASRRFHTFDRFMHGGMS